MRLVQDKDQGPGQGARSSFRGQNQDQVQEQGAGPGAGPGSRPCSSYRVQRKVQGPGPFPSPGPGPSPDPGSRPWSCCRGQAQVQALRGRRDRRGGGCTWAKKPFLERLAYRKRFHIRATNCCRFRLQPLTVEDPRPSDLNLLSSSRQSGGGVWGTGVTRVCAIDSTQSGNRKQVLSDWYQHLRQTRCRRGSRPLSAASGSSGGLRPQRRGPASSDAQEVSRLDRQTGGPQLRQTDRQ